MRKNLISIAAITWILFASQSSVEAYIFMEPSSMVKSLAHYAMGNVLDLSGETEEALKEYKLSSKFDPNNYLVHLRLGTAYARANLLDEAIEELKLVQVYDPSELQSHYLLALIYSAQKDYGKATSEYEHILKSFSKLEPENIEVYGYLGQLYYSQKKYDQAIDQFNQILLLEPQNSDVMYLLGSIFFEVDRKAEAEELFKKSIAADPEQDGSLNSLAYLYALEKTNLDEALTLINKALELDPGNAAYLDSLGWIYYQREEYPQALENLLKAESLLKDPVIYDHLGDTYYKLSETENALKYWELSLKLLPDQQDVIEKLNSVKHAQASR